MIADFNPRSSYEERLDAYKTTRKRIISIHAPHTRSDLRNNGYLIKSGMISIHAPHTRSDSVRQSTIHGGSEISIHAPHTRSDDPWFSFTLKNKISIHAPHTRSDASPKLLLHCVWYFNPRSSYEERQHFPIVYRWHDYFNPRSSYEKRPAELIFTTSSVQHFNPRSSYEERRSDTFNNLTSNISIHAPHTRSDIVTLAMRIVLLFQSTLLIRGATTVRFMALCLLRFQSTLLIRGATGAAFLPSQLPL